MSSANNYKFRIFRGRPSKILLIIIYAASWVCSIYFTFHIFFILEGKFTAPGLFLLALFSIPWLAFLYILHRVVFRRFNVSLYIDHVEIVYPPVLFFKRNAIQIYFSDVKSFDLNKNSVKVKMKNGNKFTISSSQKMHIKEEYADTSFGAREIEEMYLSYKKRESLSFNIAEPGA